jgi:hypothetical protein
MSARKFGVEETSRRTEGLDGLFDCVEGLCYPWSSLGGGHRALVVAFLGLSFSRLENCPALRRHRLRSETGDFVAAMEIFRVIWERRRRGGGEEGGQWPGI